MYSHRLFVLLHRSVVQGLLSLGQTVPSVHPVPPPQPSGAGDVGTDSHRWVVVLHRSVVHGLLSLGQTVPSVHPVPPPQPSGAGDVGTDSHRWVVVLQGSVVHGMLSLGHTVPSVQPVSICAQAGCAATRRMAAAKLVNISEVFVNTILSSFIRPASFRSVEGGSNISRG